MMVAPTRVLTGRLRGEPVRFPNGSSVGATIFGQSASHLNTPLLKNNVRLFYSQ